MWHRNLYETLVEMGHDVLLFPTQAGRSVRDHAANLMLNLIPQQVY